MNREDGFYWIRGPASILDGIEVARWESELGWTTCGWEVPIEGEVEVLSNRLVYAESS